MITLLDPVYWIVVGPTILLAMYAQVKVQSSFGRWSRVPCESRLAGAEAAAVVLDHAGIGGVSIEQHPGFLSDHYDPRAKVLRLSPQVYAGRTVAAIAVAAHEAGHAIQDAKRYPALALRSALVPVASIGSWLSWPLIAMGLLAGDLGLFKIGIVAFGAVVVFQMVTLPVEFDASRRARRVLSDAGVVRSDAEERGVRSVLSAAAMTYVAATLTALAQILYLVMLLGGARRSY